MLLAKHARRAVSQGDSGPHLDCTHLASPTGSVECDRVFPVDDVRGVEGDTSGEVHDVG